MKKVDDIEGVVEDLPCDVITIILMVIGVQSLQKYLACLACNAKVVHLFIRFCVFISLDMNLVS